MVIELDVILKPPPHVVAPPEATQSVVAAALIEVSPLNTSVPLFTVKVVMNTSCACFGVAPVVGAAEVLKIMEAVKLDLTVNDAKVPVEVSPPPAKLFTVQV